MRRIAAKNLLSVGALLAVGACASTINPDAPQRANAALAAMERASPTTESESGATEQLERLWHDKPEYLALLHHKPVKRIRMISAVAARYPVWLLLNGVRARVRVSFVVGLDGHVEDARVLESSDSRFDTPALEAMRQFKFLPAEGPSGPEREMEVQPFHFEPRGP